MSERYGLAKLIIGVVAILGIIGMVLGVIFILYASQQARGGLMMAILTGSPVLAGAAMLYVAAQIALAQIETAENTSRLKYGLEHLLNKIDRLAAEAASRDKS